MKKLMLTVLFLMICIPAVKAQNLIDDIAKFAHDEVEGVVEADYNKVWAASKLVLNKKGKVTESDPHEGEMEAILEGVNVEVKLGYGEGQTELQVSARNQSDKQPNLEMAELIYNDIVKELKK